MFTIVPCATAEHLRQHHHGAMDTGEEICVHHIAKIFDGLRFNWSYRDDARVIDQDVDAPKVFCRALY